jgi:DNA-binding transcriptional MerR regulator
MADEDVAETTLGLTVAVVARRVGVAPATLRTWERRYGICPSDRSSGGHRRYCITDVARLELMRRLVLSGMPAGEAARVALKSEIKDVQACLWLCSLQLR